MTEAPRVLVVSPSIFNQRTGGGITLTNLFRGWPADRIAAVHSDGNEPSTEVCRRYYRLTKSELQWVWPLSLAVHRPDVSQPAAAGAGDQAGSNSARWLARAARRFKNAIAREGLNERATLTPALHDFIANFRPHVVYTLLGSLSYLRLVRQIVGVTGAHVVVHIMDDWPNTLYRSGLIAPFFRAQMSRELAHSFKSAAARLAISASMAHAYERRYGMRFVPFSNTPDLAAWRQYQRGDWGVSKSPRIVYSGSVDQNAQWQSLVDLADAVERLADLDAVMIIRTPQDRDPALRAAFSRFTRTRIEPPLMDDEIGTYLRDADVLVLPVNFDEVSAKYVRYSSPTKLAAYLAIATPILAYGPPEVDQIARATRDGWGLAVQRRDSHELEAALRKLLGDPAMREQLGRAALSVAQRDYDAVRVRSDFRRVLTEAASRGGAA